MTIDLQKITVKQVAAPDIDAMVAYRIQYLAEMQGEHTSNIVEKLRLELKDYLSSEIAKGNLVAMVAEHEGTIVAYGAIVLRTVPGDFSCSSYAEGDILNMYTIPEARKQGISTLVLNELIDEARKRGLVKLALHTTKAGEKLYRSAGFSEPAYPFLELLL